MPSPTDADLLVALDYYAPYVSGLTEAARIVAEGLAEQGWRVRVVAARHDRQLPPRERLGGVEVVRTPVLARVGKGVVSPLLPRVVASEARRAALVNLHLPMLEAGLIARLIGDRRPLVATYQCDVSLPGGWLNRLQVRAVDRSSATTLRRARTVVPSSRDYAEHSRLWPAMQGHLRAISPPCLDRSGGTPAFRDGAGMHLGFLGRIVEEKGLEYLVDGFLQAARPEDRLLVAGDHARVAGGSVVDALRERIAGDPRIRLLGFLPENRLSDFYASLDVFALPSVNSLEAFGIVQVEAMMAGVPVIASDLPGVRVPVRETGFGIVVPPRDPRAIGRALAAMRERPFDRSAGAFRARERYGVAGTVEQYAAAFRALGVRVPA